MFGCRDMGILRYWESCSWVVPGVAGRFQGASGSFPGDLWEALGKVLGLSWQPLGSFLGCLEVSWESLGPSWRPLGASGESFGMFAGFGGSFICDLGGS